MTTALLSLDFMHDVVTAFGAEAIAARMGKTCAAARSAGIPVIHVAVRFRPGYPEIAPANKAFAAIRESGMFLDGTEGSAFHAAVAPVTGDVTVVKRRVSAFSGSDLQTVLRSMGVETIVMGGLSTSGVVLGTTRVAADLDYRVIILGDCCEDSDGELHRILLDRLLPRYAEVVSAEAWVATLPVGD